MENLLKEIEAFPEVSAALVYDHQKGVLALHGSPPNTDKKELGYIGQSLGKLFQKRRLVNGLEMKFEKTLLMARPITDDALLIAFCIPSANMSLVNMNISMTIPQLQEALDIIRNPPASTPPPEAKKAKPAPKPAPKPVTKQTPLPPKPESKEVDIDAVISGPLASTFSEFQSALAFAIGPVSEMVLKECIEEWSQDGKCSDKRLGELVTIVCREIDDDELEEEFKEKIDHLLLIR